MCFINTSGLYLFWLC